MYTYISLQQRSSNIGFLKTKPDTQLRDNISSARTCDKNEERANCREGRVAKQSQSAGKGRVHRHVAGSAERLKRYCGQRKEIDTVAVHVRKRARASESLEFATQRGAVYQLRKNRFTKVHKLRAREPRQANRGSGMRGWSWRPTRRGEELQKYREHGAGI